MPAAEPYGSPQGCTVRPRKGSGKCSMGVDSMSHYCLALPRALHPWVSIIGMFVENVSDYYVGR